jgi:hypothetical protein
VFAKLVGFKNDNRKKLAYYEICPFTLNYESVMVYCTGPQGKLFEVMLHYLPIALTLGAVRLVLQELAAFHATSWNFIKTFPGVRLLKLFFTSLTAGPKISWSVCTGQVFKANMIAP